MKEHNPTPAFTGEFLLYETPGGTLKVEVLHSEENIWLTQKRMAELFSVEIPTINYHLKEIFKTAELAEASVIRKFLIPAADGKTYKTNLYSLDAIIAVGYRVNSHEATQFRIWATRTLKEFLIKGFVLDDERLKQGNRLGKDYFQELLERIREIRASERRFYQKITDIYQQCSIDYDAKSPITRTFFASVQNKLEWAITGHTAAELIASRANATKPNMGLTTWKNSPEGKIMKSDSRVAKNYLNEKELGALNRIVTMYLDFAELQAERQQAMRMTEWAERLDAFLLFNGYQVLSDAGKVGAEVARRLADTEYEKFRIVQDQTFESDFDKEVKRLQAASRVGQKPLSPKTKHIDSEVGSD